MTSVEIGKQTVENEIANDIYRLYISIKKRMGDDVEPLKQERDEMLLGKTEFAKKALEIYAKEIEEYYESLKD